MAENESNRKCLYITPEDSKAITELAKKAGLSFSKYVTQTALSKTSSDDIINNKIIIQTDDLLKHAEEIGEIRKLLNMVVLTVVQSKEVYEVDIKRIMELMVKIEEIENKLLSEVMQRRNRISIEVKKKVKEYTSGGENNADHKDPRHQKNVR